MAGERSLLRDSKHEHHDLRGRCAECKTEIGLNTISVISLCSCVVLCNHYLMTSRRTDADNFCLHSGGNGPRQSMSSCLESSHKDLSSSIRSKESAEDNSLFQSDQISSCAVGYGIIPVCAIQEPRNDTSGCPRRFHNEQD